MNKCLKLKNIETGVLEKWSDGVLGLNHYSSTPMLHYSELLGALKCAIMPKVGKSKNPSATDGLRFIVHQLSGIRSDEFQKLILLFLWHRSEGRGEVHVLFQLVYIVAADYRGRHRLG
jgi:hypothetical protein